MFLCAIRYDGTPLHYTAVLANLCLYGKGFEPEGLIRTRRTGNADERDSFSLYWLRLEARHEINCIARDLIWPRKSRICTYYLPFRFGDQEERNQLARTDEERDETARVLHQGQERRREGGWSRRLNPQICCLHPNFIPVLLLTANSSERHDCNECCNRSTPI